jgi:hypothetical protein
MSRCCRLAHRCAWKLSCRSVPSFPGPASGITRVRGGPARRARMWALRVCWRGFPGACRLDRDVVGIASQPFAVLCGLRGLILPSAMCRTSFTFGVEITYKGRPDGLYAVTCHSSSGTQTVRFNPTVLPKGFKGLDYPWSRGADGTPRGLTGEVGGNAARNAMRPGVRIECVKDSARLHRRGLAESQPHAVGDERRIGTGTY